MSNQFRILVVGTNYDAFEYLMGRMNGLQRRNELPNEVTLQRVDSLESFQDYVKTNHIDAVITDVLFRSPNFDLRLNPPDEPNGKIVVEYCLANNKPVVWLSTHPDSAEAEQYRNWGLDKGLDIIANIPVNGRVQPISQSSEICQMWDRVLMALAPFAVPA